MRVLTHSSANEPWLTRCRRDLRRNKGAYLLVIPVIVFYILFCYKPMYGALIAFKDYSPRLGLSGSAWVGLKNFRDFFTSPDFARLLRNTLTISITNLIFAFPAPILLALCLNEITNNGLRRVVQTASYMPHFISLVVVCGMIKTFVGTDGIISSVVGHFGGRSTNLLTEPDMFLPVYVISDIWQGIGWESIIYLAALAGIDVEQYEAADIDGAGRMARMFNITLPAIQTTIITMLILRVGRLMNLGYEKIILLYNPAIYKTSDVISSYVYRMGFETQNWGYSTAVGLFNSVINLFLLAGANMLSKKMTDSSIW